MRSGTLSPNVANAVHQPESIQIQAEIGQNSWQFQFLRLTGFRNYSSRSIDLHARIVAVVGPNGTGKTNLIEALHVLCTARGFAPDREALGHDAPFFLVEGRLGVGAPLAEVSCGYWPGRGKKLICDRRPLPRLSDHLGQLPVVAILPEDTEVVRGGAKARRHWLDSLLVQFDRNYLGALMRYDRSLMQRNALLYAVAAGEPLDKALLDLYDRQLAESGSCLIATRKAFLEAFQPVFRQRHRQIVQLQETPALLYEPNWPDAETLAEGVFRSRNADLKAGRSLCGPHRDELRFELDGKPVRKFGSQGQVKSWIIALRLAQYAWFVHYTGRSPLLLLDDLFDKLDEHRMQAIGCLLREEVAGQIFVTDTSAHRLALVWKQAGLNGVQWIDSNDLNP
jgi:DNA replication and repair protein RecF